ncbi:MAG: hypothetical protein ACTSP4_12290 [Candidatus Hodarchaeales archaeon]
MKPANEIPAIQELKPTRQQYLVFSIIASILFTMIFFFGSFFFFIIVVQLLLMSLVPDPFEPAQYAWIETIKALGLIVFVILIFFMFLGCLKGRYKFSLAGSIILIIPVFSIFAIPMNFFLAGFRSMLLLWLPLLEIYPGLLTLGDILFTPFIAPIMFYWQLSEGNLNIEPYNSFFPLVNFIIPLVLLVSGIFIMIFGSINRLIGKKEGKITVDFWIYKYSRHPQILGLLMMAYGLIIIMGIWPIMVKTPPLRYSG